MVIIQKNLHFVNSFLHVDSVSKVGRFTKVTLLNKEKRLKPKKCFIIELINKQ